MNIQPANIFNKNSIEVNQKIKKSELIYWGMNLMSENKVKDNNKIISNIQNNKNVYLQFILKKVL